jgi:dTMP kinase
MIEKGLFICIEGIDGVGKTTLGALLAQWFGERGFPCVFSKEPTGIGAGAALRQSAVTGRKSLEEELALFLQDRRDHVERTIAPALQRGNAVILDRCYWSNAAYQGVRGGDWKKILADNEAFVPRPDLVLLLDTDPDKSLERSCKCL